MAPKPQVVVGVAISALVALLSYMWFAEKQKRALKRKGGCVPNDTVYDGHGLLKNVSDSTVKNTGGGDTEVSTITGKESQDVYQKLSSLTPEWERKDNSEAQSVSTLESGETSNIDADAEGSDTVTDREGNKVSNNESLSCDKDLPCSVEPEEIIDVQIPSDEEVGEHVSCCSFSWCRYSCCEKCCLILNCK